VALADLAATSAAHGHLWDALRFHTVNTEMNTRSTFALRQLAQAQVAAHDTTAAIAAYERALRINPDDSQSRRALAALRSGR
jgi:predicted TPR repeat methyltransferase